MRVTLVVFASIALLNAQELYNLERVVREAAGYPAIRAGAERVNAAAAGIRLARTAYLPRVDLIAQANRATRNNIFGMLLPQAVLPSISGPPRMENSLTSVWGSATGFLVSWEPFDFGLRRSQVARAEAERARTEAAARVTELDVRAAAADAFLTVLAARESVLAAEAGVKRGRALLEVVEAQVRAQLRPGADASRSRAELAAAENQSIRAGQAEAEARAGLALYLNREPAQIAIDSGPLLAMPPPAPEESPVEHPRVAERERAVEEAGAARKVVERSWYPRFNLQAASYARGTGALPDGRTLGGINGLGPNIYNWGAGLTVTFPALEFPSLKARLEIEEARRRAEQARLEQVRREVNAEALRASAELEGARRVARNTPVQLEAARAAEQQALARYRAGLGGIAEVAEAQRLVTQAEIDDALARLNVWRGLLRAAYARGEIDSFLRLAGK